MSEKETSGQPDQNASGENQETGKDLVSYDTHRKLLGEKKALQSKLLEFERANKASEESAMAEQSKWKELAEQRAKEKKEIEDKYTKAYKTFGQQIFTKEAKSVALQMGADPAYVDDLLKLGSWENVEIGDDFTVNESQLKESFAKLQKEKPIFFKKQMIGPKDVHPSAKASDFKKAKLSELKSEELEAKLKELGGKLF